MIPKITSEMSGFRSLNITYKHKKRRALFYDYDDTFDLIDNGHPVKSFEIDESRVMLWLVTGELEI